MLKRTKRDDGVVAIVYDAFVVSGVVQTTNITRYTDHNDVSGVHS